MPKRSLKSQDDDVLLWNGKPVRSLHPFDLKLELKYYKLLAKGEKVKVSEQRNRLSDHLRSLLTFQTLPDEIVLKIIKMTVSHSSDRDKVIQISKLSSRFNRIARDTSLWRGAVGLALNRHSPHKFWKQLPVGGAPWKQFLGEGVTSLTLWNSGIHSSDFAHLYGEDIATIAGNCPNLASLTLHDMAVPVNSWPTQALGLKNLRINTGSQIFVRTNDMFEDVKLDLIFPKLESFIFSVPKHGTAKPLLKDTILLPDMTACKNLQEVHIAMIANWGHAYKFKIPSELEDTGPFPRCLKMLRLHGNICNYPEETIRINRGPDCKVILQDPLDCWAALASKWFSTSR